MIKRILYCLVILVMVSCEDVYIANLNESEDILVFEARITNTPSNNFIRISKTTNFYENKAAPGIPGARISLMDVHGGEVEAYDNGDGYYGLDYGAIPGQQYKLKINLGGVEYESEYETMLVAPVIDTLKVKIDTIKYYRYSSFGDPILKKFKAASSFVDLDVNEQISHYFFKRKMIVQYRIDNDAPGFGTPPPPYYGWRTLPQERDFNIAGPPEFGSFSQIKDHSIGYHKNEIGDYVDEEVLKELGILSHQGWVMILDQYGISEKTYNFYKTLKAQLEAEGKLFDPVYPQIQSNIRCVSDPDRKVIGYFELSSHNRTYYYHQGYYSAKMRYYQFDDFIPFPADGMVQQNDPPPFWEYPNKPGRPLWQ